MIDGLEQLGPQHLAARRADRPQQRHLAAPLGDDDLERVVDREARHDEPDRGEHQQERVEEAEPLAHVVLRLLGDLRAGQRFDTGGKHGGDAGCQLRLGDARLRRRPSPRRSRRCRRAAPAGRWRGRRSRRSRRRASRRIRTGRCRRAVNSCGPVWVSTVTVSPMRRSPLSALPLSTTSSPGPGGAAAVGQLPRAQRARRRSSCRTSARPGRGCRWRHRRRRRSGRSRRTSPWASATPATAVDRRHDRLGDAAPLLSPRLEIDAALDDRTYESVSAKMSANRSSNVRLMVSVNTSVPDRKATPSMHRQSRC